jgi:protein-S-isoprenylcysteine O-methyltransferase Ste14
VFACNPHKTATATPRLRSPKAKTTGPYAFVRHPMYAGALVTPVGIPLALGSWWGLPALLLILPVLIWRLPDEERFLRQNLPGYADYQTR